MFSWPGSKGLAKFLMLACMHFRLLTLLRWGCLESSPPLPLSQRSNINGFPWGSSVWSHLSCPDLVSIINWITSRWWLSCNFVSLCKLVSFRCESVRLAVTRWPRKMEKDSSKESASFPSAARISLASQNTSLLAFDWETILVSFSWLSFCWWGT